MISISTLVLAAAMAGPGQTVLLDFYSDSCSPCRSMEPTVRRLIAEGVEIRKVNVDREQQLTRRFGVEFIPTFVMLAEGREVDRVVGPASYDRLRQMIAAAGVTPSRSAQQPAFAGSPVVPTVPVAAPATRLGAATAAAPDSRQRALHATVRLRVADPAGNSFGTGTIIHTRENEALVVTCGHLFRESSGQGRIEVDLFVPGARGPAPGKLLAYDLKNDVALVAIWPSIKVTPVPVAAPNHLIRPGDRVFSIGCDRGADASIRESQVTALNKYQGPANIEVAGQPVIGRSGGGLFTAEGQLIGVCNLADPQDDEGIYAALSLIHDHLAANLPRGILHDAPQIAAAGAGPQQPGRGAPAPPSIPREMPGVPQDRGAGVQTLPVSGATSNAQLLAEILRNPGRDTEVIVLIRSKSDPQATTRTITIADPSPRLLEALADPYTTAVAGAAPTVLETSDTPSSVASRPDRHLGPGQDPIMRGQWTR